MYAVRVKSVVIRKRDLRVLSPTKRPHIVLHNVFTKYTKFLRHFFAVNLCLVYYRPVSVVFLVLSSHYMSHGIHSYVYDSTVIDYHLHKSSFSKNLIN